MDNNSSAPGPMPEQSTAGGQYNNQAAPQSASQVPKDKKPLLLGLLAGGVMAILVIILSWFFVFSPSVQAKKASTAFMKAATTNDTAKLVKLADAEDDASTKQFLEKSVPEVKGEFSLKEKTNKDGKWYFLYTLTNAKKKEARTIVEKKDGKWIVNSFVYGSNLALVPGKSSSEPDTSTSTPTPSPTVACLSDSDVAVFNDAKPEDEGYGVDFEMDGYRTYVGDTHFFEPDSTTYTYPDQSSEMTDKLVTFYNTNKNKEFTIHLSGKVRESSSSAAGVKLARQRSEKVKTELVAKGIPSDRVIIDEAQPNSAEYTEGSERNVDVTIRKKIPCTAPASSGSGR